MAAHGGDIRIGTGVAHRQPAARRGPQREGRGIDRDVAQRIEADRLRDPVDGQRRRGAGHAARGVGDHHGVAAGLAGLHVVQGQGGARGAAHVCPVQLPLVGKRRRARGRHAEGDIGRDVHRRAGRLRGEVRRFQPHQHQRIISSRGYGHYLAQAGRHVGLAIAVEAPGRDGAIALQGHGVIITGGNGRHAAQAGRHVRLTIAIEAPGHEGAVVLQGHGMRVTRRDGRHATQAGRHVCLTIAIVPPGRDGAVILQDHGMRVTRGNGRHTAQAGRDVHLTVVVDTPDHNGAVALQGHRVKIAGGNVRHAAQAGRDRGLTIAGVTPGRDGAVALQSHRVGIVHVNGRYAAKAGRHVRLAIVAAAPRHHYAGQGGDIEAPGDCRCRQIRRVSRLADRDVGAAGARDGHGVAVHGGHGRVGTAVTQRQSAAGSGAQGERGGIHPLVRQRAEADCLRRPGDFAPQGHTVRIARRNGRQIIHAGGCACLAIAIPAPRQHRGVVAQDLGMRITRGNGRDAAQAGRDARLTVVVVAPGDDGAVAFQRHGVRVTRGNGGDTGQAGRHARLAIVVVAPGDNGAVVLQRHGVEVTRGNGRDAGQAGRHARLAVVVEAPGDDGTVVLQRHGVRVARGNRRDAAQAGRKRRFAVAVEAPGRDGAVALQGHGVRIARGNGRHIAQAGRDDRLAGAVVTPGDDGAVTLQGHGVRITRGNRRDAGQAARGGGLPIGVVTPRHDRSGHAGHAENLGHRGRGEIGRVASLTGGDAGAADARDRHHVAIHGGHGRVGTGVGQRQTAGHRGAQGEGCGVDRLGRQGVEGNRLRHPVDRQHGRVTGRGAVGIGDHHGVKARLAGLHIGQDQCGVGCAAEVRAVLPPLVREGCRARGGDFQGDVGRDADGCAHGLCRDDGQLQDLGGATGEGRLPARGAQQVKDGHIGAPVKNVRTEGGRVALEIDADETGA